ALASGILSSGRISPLGVAPDSPRLAPVLTIATTITSIPVPKRVSGPEVAPDHRKASSTSEPARSRPDTGRARFHAGGSGVSADDKVSAAARSRDTAWGMSEENVEIVQRAIAAVNNRDLDGYLALCASDVELITPVAPIEGPN